MVEIKDTACRHPESIEVALGLIPDEESLADTGAFFKILGEPTRLKILYALSSGELCVHDLSEATSASVSAVSHQLAILRQAKLVATRRDGKVIYYRLDDDHIHSLIDIAREHLSE